jgi:hypothetical protein
MPPNKQRNVAVQATLPVSGWVSNYGDGRVFQRD